MAAPSGMIAHMDLDSFFVSVEILRNPSLKGKAVIVGGSRERGIVTTCTYEARKYGVHSAMPMKTAVRLCPHAIVLRGDYSEYTRYSRWVTDIIASKAPLFEKASVDEFYIDLQGMDRFFDPLSWTAALRDLIISDTGLPLSFGIGKNKMIAKMATNEAKPNGFLQVPPGREKEFLGPLEVNKIPGIGRQAEKILNYHGLRLISDIHKSPAATLEKILGKWGVELWNKVQGDHISVLNTRRESKSISKENTFHENMTDMDFLMGEIVRMSERVCFELRREGKVAGFVAIKLRYPDFETTSMQRAISYASADDEIIPVARELFHQLYKKGAPVRLLGVRLGDLSSDAIQANLFFDNDRKRHLYKTLDEVKNRFGRSSVVRASGNK